MISNKFIHIHIPRTGGQLIRSIIFNKKNQEIFRKEGTLPCDRIFQILHKDNSVIPVNKIESEKIIQDGKGKVLLSYDPELKRGQQITIKSFENKMLYNAIVTLCNKMSLKQSEGLQIEAQNYLNKGGRKDTGWMVSFAIEYPS